jgi:hypothetical protein
MEKATGSGSGPVATAVAIEAVEGSTTAASSACRAVQ